MFDEFVQNITDFDVLTDSLRAFVDNLSVSSVIMSILVIFMLVGLVDKLRGNKLGYGEKFDEGFNAMGPLALAVVGIVSLAPVLLIVLEPIITPVYNLIGADPAMFPSSFLALDMGGYTIASQLAGDNVAIGLYSGLIVASMMGITMSFTIPYATSMMKKEDHPVLAMGILIGIVTMPLGCIVGGLMMGFTDTPLGFSEILINTLPVIILAVIIAVMLLLCQRVTLRLFTAFGTVITWIITISPAIAVFQYLTGIHLPLFNKMVTEDPVMGGIPLENGLLLVGKIAVVLIGAFPMIHFLNKHLSGIMGKFGKKTGINTESSTALLTQLASSIPIWSMMGQMNRRGKLVNIAFAVSGSFVLGDVLAFVGGTAPQMVFPVIVAKLIAGCAAVALMALLPAFKKMELTESPSKGEEIDGDN